MQPLFSIITVTRNAEHTLARTLQSVASQSYRNYEHIVMDGASTDGTLGIVEKHRTPAIRLVSDSDKGIYDAMNKAMEIAEGEYLIFLNSGDKFHTSDTLMAYAEAIEHNGRPDMLYGQTEIVDDEGKTIGARHLTAPSNLTLRSFRNGMMVCHQAMAVAKKIAPFYNLKYKFSSDYEWCIICLQHSQHNHYIDATVVDYLSEGTTTANRRVSLYERYRIMCTYFGTVPTVLRHVKFACRYLFSKKK